MSRTGVGPVRVERSLRIRLLFFVVLALLPAAAVSVVQGMDRIQRDQEDVRALLVQTARATASDEDNLLASAEQILRAHANQPEIRAAAPTCNEVLGAALEGLAFFPNIARISRDGVVVCAALPYDAVTFTDRDWWPEAQSRPGFFITAPSISPITHGIVIGGVLPLRTPDGAFDGTLNIALDVQWLDFMLRAQELPRTAVAALFNQAGALITATDQEAAAEIFENGISPLQAGTLQSAVGVEGEAWSYAIAQLAGSNAYVAFAMPDAVLFRSTYVHVATDLLLPALMLGLASVAIWIATDRLVLRWIDYLRRMAVAYSHGHYSVRPSVLHTAPDEFRLLGETMETMASAVDERDRSLRDAVAQKSTLIREIHHRVKNNLQIVMSLLSLQANQLRDTSAREALRDTQVRVNALALVHRILHDVEDFYLIDISELLSNLANQVHEGFGAAKRDLKLEVDLIPRQVTSDVAVPLTLFTVEALTNVYKHAFPLGTERGKIYVSLCALPDKKLRLTIEDCGVGIPPSTKDLTVGSRLMRAFSAQVRGTVTIGARVGGGTIIALTFPDVQRTETDARSDSSASARPEPATGTDSA
jgi:two-component sensor histidine kinase